MTKTDMTMLRKRILLVVAVMVLALQGAVAKKVQLDIDNTYRTYEVTSDITEIQVFVGPEASAENYMGGGYTLQAPDGYRMVAWGGVYTGYLSVSTGTDATEVNCEAGTDNNTFNDFWSQQSGMIDIRVSGVGANAYVTVRVYNPNNITNKDAEGQFLDQFAAFLTFTSYTDYNGYPKPQHLKLADDITLPNRLEIPKDIDIELDLNGHTLSRSNLTTATADGSVIYVASGGKLTITDTSADGTGQVTGGKALYGGGVLNDGTFTLEGGSITGNFASQAGGGVCNRRTMTMTNGTISVNSFLMGNDQTRGGGIFNDTGAELTVSGGMISNNYHLDSSTQYAEVLHGGGVFNKGKFTFSGGNIESNSARGAGGGVYNDAVNGTQPCEFFMSGGSIWNNHAESDYSYGVYNLGVMMMSAGTVSGKRAIPGSDGRGICQGESDAANIIMFGTPYVDYLYLPANKKLKLSSPLLDGADIKVRVGHAYSVPFTDCGDDGYVGLHPGASADKYIHYTDANDGLIIYNNEVARLPYIQNSVQYVEEIDDNTERAVFAPKCFDLNKLADGAGASFGVGYNDTESWFALTDNKTFNNYRLTAVGNVKLILADGKTLTANNGVIVPAESSLTVYGQGENSGKLTAKCGASAIHAAIGGLGGVNSRACGPIHLYGGIISATGGNNAAGIGGGEHEVHSTIDIKRATVTATGGLNAAGIGTGWGANIWETDEYNRKTDVSPLLYNNTITIHSGEVTATGSGGAGIGGGTETYFLGTINILGGTVTAVGNNTSSMSLSAAGIGSGAYGSCYLYIHPNHEPKERFAEVNISGGEVTARGGKHAASIGGGEQSARDGINPIIDPNNYQGVDLPVFEGGGAHVNITGGTVRLLCSGGEGNKSNGAQGIGHGAVAGTDTYNAAPSGNLTIYDGARVEYPNATFSSSYAPFERREEYLRSNVAIIQPCTHAGELNIVDGTYHVDCKYCKAKHLQSEHVFGEYGQCEGCGLIAIDNDATDNANTIILRHWSEGDNKNKSFNIVLKGRTFYRNGLWNTICLPFELTENDVQDMLAGPSALMTLNTSSFNETNGELTLDFMNAIDLYKDKSYAYIPSGLPCIIKWKNTEGTEQATTEWTDPVFRGVKLSASTIAIGGNIVKFKGTFDCITEETEDRSILFMGTRTETSSGKTESVLYFPDGKAETTIGACRAYFELGEDYIAGDDEPEEFVRSFVLNFGDEEQTGIINAPRIADRRERTTDNTVYDLQGRRVARAEANSSLFTIHSSLKKGLYINGHRKVVVK